RFDSSVEPFQRALKENIYFEMSHAAPWGKVQMEAAVQIAGADHIIFGSSYPVRREWLTGGREFIESLNLSEEEKELLLSGNARKIYNLKES
ncbi:MAG: amidohydrolase family protein, partial [Spirochaetales bacterium]|nr:amidohydrolase family protein [Spirochaetales bacterium]